MAVPLDRIKTVAALRCAVAAWRAAGERVALVPTMGALHEGHLSLVDLAREKAERCVVSIFVNPTQFGPNEDLDAYPRDTEGDLAKLAARDVDAAFLPDVSEIYPEGFATTVRVSGISDGLCGDARPGHFDGVATVVTKLLLQCLPDIAIFGEKDYQQLLVIRRLALDLNIPVEILGGPIKRETDGLALSSRNAYLSATERQAAPKLQQALQQTAARLKNGDTMDNAARDALAELDAAGFRPDYFELRDAANLQPLARLETRPARLLAAAWLGRTRLIDNIAVIR
jgi:pantoate--beta-alanine ligase